MHGGDHMFVNTTHHHHHSFNSIQLQQWQIKYEYQNQELTLMAY